MNQSNSEARVTDFSPSLLPAAFFIVELSNSGKWQTPEMVTLAIISRSDGIAVQRDEKIEKQEIKELFFTDNQTGLWPIL